MDRIISLRKLNNILKDEKTIETNGEVSGLFKYGNSHVLVKFGGDAPHQISEYALWHIPSASFKEFNYFKPLNGRDAFLEALGTPLDLTKLLKGGKDDGNTE